MLHEYFVLALLTVARFLDSYLYYIIAFFVIYNALAYYFVKRWDGKLYAAAESGDVEALEVALQYKPNINVKKENDFTPLMIATQNNHPSIVAILLKNSECQMEAMDRHGRTSFLIAVHLGWLDVVKLLIQHGAVKTATDVDGNTALLMAAFTGHLQVLKLLLRENADVKWRNKDGLNAMMVAIAVHSAEHNNRLSTISAILETGKYDTEFKTPSGWTALTKAAFRGHLDIVKLLIGCGSDVNAASSTGFTPLLAASQNGWGEIARFLMDNGAKLDAALKDGATGLIAASFGGYTDIVGYFLDENRSSAMEVATRLKQSYKQGSTALMAACCNGYIDVVKILVDAGSDVNTRNASGWCALMVAADRGYLGIARLLVNHGALVNVYNISGYSPLMCACKCGYAEICKCLLEAGAHVNFASIIESLGEVVAECERDEVAAASIRKLQVVKQLMKTTIVGFLPPIMLAIGSNEPAVSTLVLEYCEKQARALGVQSDIDMHMSCILPEFEQLFERAKALLASCEVEATFSSAPAAAVTGGGAVTTADSTAQPVDEDTDKDEVDSAEEDAADEVDFIYECLQTPLIFAIYLGNERIVDHLLQLGVDVNQGNSDGTSPVMIAAFCGDALILKHVLERNPTVAVWQDRGKTLTRITASLLRKFQLSMCAKVYFRTFVSRPVNTVLGFVCGGSGRTGAADVVGLSTTPSGDTTGNNSKAHKKSE